MIDLSKVFFEEKAYTEFGDFGETRYYFTYDCTDLPSVSPDFKSKEHYEAQYGKVFCITLCIGVWTGGDKYLCASPTCEIEDGVSDVDWVDIEASDEEITNILRECYDNRG